MTTEHTGEENTPAGMTPNGVRILPVFRGYTVDVRLGEFRRATWTAEGIPLGIEFLRFDSEEGDALLVEYLDTLAGDELDEFLKHWP